MKTRKRKKRQVFPFYYQTEEERKQAERIIKKIKREIPGTRCVLIRETAPA
jgi:hypothetical protein